MRLQGVSRDQLVDYIQKQIENLFPVKNQNLRELVVKNIDEALDRMSFCLSHISCWPAETFDFQISGQYCMFLWYLGNTIWKNHSDVEVCTKFFLLNKALNGFDCSYDNNLPNIFLVGHTVGIVLVKNQYPDYMVLHQGVTVGRIDEKLPRLEPRIIFYPHSSVIGDCVIRSGSVVSAGVHIINQSTNADSYVFKNGRDLEFKSGDGNIFGKYFK